MSGSKVATISRYWSLPGMLAMLVGMGMVLFEIKSGLMFERLGLTGRIILITCGLSLSVWGLKEIIIGRWPRFARRGYLFHLPMEGALFLIILIALFCGALVGRSNTLLMVFAIMAAMFIMNGWFTFTMLKRLSVTRQAPRRVMSGENFTVSLTLANRKRFLSIWLMEVEDLIVHEQGALKSRVVFVRVPPRGERRGHYQASLVTRGRYTLGPVTVNTRFPLGLVQRGVGVATRSELLVYPRVGRLKPAWKRRLQNSAELVSYLKPMPGPFNDEMHRIREYRIGDDPRMIHWATTARMNELMVREFRESRDRDLLVIVDAWLPSRKQTAQAELHEESNGEAGNGTQGTNGRRTNANIERGIRLGLTICLEQLRDSRESSLSVRLVGQQHFDWRGDRAEDHLEQLLDGFALLETSTSTAVENLWQGLELADSRRRMVVITPRPEEVFRELSERTPTSSSVAISHGDLQVLGLTDAELAAVFEDS